MKFSSNWKKIKESLENLNYTDNLDKIKGLAIIPDKLVLNYKITQNSDYYNSKDSKHEESKISYDEHSDQEWNKLNTFGANIKINDEIGNIGKYYL